MRPPPATPALLTSTSSPPQVRRTCSAADAQSSSEVMSSAADRSPGRARGRCAAPRALGGEGVAERGPEAGGGAGDQDPRARQRHPPTRARRLALTGRRPMLHRRPAGPDIDEETDMLKTVAVLCALLLTLTACGGGDDPRPRKHQGQPAGQPRPGRHRADRRGGRLRLRGHGRRHRRGEAAGVKLLDDDAKVARTPTRRLRAEDADALAAPSSAASTSRSCSTSRWAPRWSR